MDMPNSTVEVLRQTEASAHPGTPLRGSLVQGVGCSVQGQPEKHPKNLTDVISSDSGTMTISLTASIHFRILVIATGPAIRLGA